MGYPVHCYIVSISEWQRSQGVEVDMDTAKYKNEKLTAVYIKEEIGGFAVHLVQK